MMTRNVIIEMLMANVSESRLYDHFDLRIVVEGFADQLVQFNDKHCRQLAMLKAELDANIAVLRREMDSAKLNCKDFMTHKVLKGLSLGLQGGLSETSDMIDQFMSQLADTHAEYATKLAQAKEEFDREIAALKQDLIEAHQELAMLRAIDGFDRSGRGPNDVLN
jgi:hypothetical protein